MSIVKMPFADCVGCKTRWKFTSYEQILGPMHCPMCGGRDFAIGFNGKFRHGQQIPITYRDGTDPLD